MTAGRIGSRGTARSSLTVQLLHIGHAAGRGATNGRVRFVGLLCATLALALALLSVVAVCATYAGRTERGAARSPVITAPAENGQQPGLLWKETGDEVHDLPVQVIFIEPLTADAPLPPGLTSWPRPGQAVLSPGLVEQGAREEIRTRYGHFAGLIGSDGLAGPGERLAYVRPAAGALTVDNARPVYAFGLADPWPIGDIPDVKSLPVFLSLLTTLLLLPAGALTVVAARLGAAGRDRRTALVTALGGSGRDLALISVGEAAIPLALGTATAAVPVVAGLSTDLRLPWINYLLAASDLREVIGWLIAALVAAPALVAAAVVLLHPRRAHSRSTRPVGGASGRLIRVAASLCPVFLLVLSWFPSMFGGAENTTVLTLWLMIGMVGALATFPAVIALFITALARGVTALGRRRGLPGALLAGRWTQGRPGLLARLVSGVVLAVGLLSVVQVVPSVFGQFVQEARAARGELGRSMLTVSTAGATAADVTTWTEDLPPATLAVRLSMSMESSESSSGERTGAAPAADSAREVSPRAVLRGDCPALAALMISCPPAEGDSVGVRLSEAGPRLQPLMRLTMVAEEVTVVRGAATDAAPSPDASATLILFTPDGSDLPVSALKRTAVADFGPGAAVEPIGEGQLVGITLGSTQQRWIPLLGSVGVLLIALSAALNNLSEILRFARTIAPVSVLTGSRRVYASVAVWTIMAPLWLAAVLGAVGAVWITTPFTAPPRNGTLSGALLIGTVGVLMALSAVITVWAAVSAVRESQRWRPHAD